MTRLIDTTRTLTGATAQAHAPVSQCPGPCRSCGMTPPAVHPSLARALRLESAQRARQAEDTQSRRMRLWRRSHLAQALGADLAGQALARLLDALEVGPDEEPQSLPCYRESDLAAARLALAMHGRLEVIRREADRQLGEQLRLAVAEVIDRLYPANVVGLALRTGDWEGLPGCGD